MAKSVKKDKPKYCDIIGTLMTEKKESQQALADALGVTRNVVENWLGNRSKLDIENLTKIARHYDVPTDYILGITPIRKKDATLRSVSDFTGLSESSLEAIQYLAEADRANEDNKYLGTLNDFLSIDTIRAFLNDLVLLKEESLFLRELIEQYCKSDFSTITSATTESMKQALHRFYEKCRYRLFSLQEDFRNITEAMYHTGNSIKKAQELDVALLGRLVLFQAECSEEEFEYNAQRIKKIARHEDGRE